MAVNTDTAVSALLAQIDTLSPDASAEQLAYLSNAIAQIGGRASVLDLANEADTQKAALGAEGTAQVGRVQSAGDNQMMLVQAEGTTQVQAVQDAAGGGGRFAVIDADVTLPVGFAAAYLVTADQAVTITLPDATTLDGPGARVLTLVSRTPFPASLVAADGTTLATVSGYKTATLDLLDNTTAKGRWRVALFRAWHVEPRITPIQNPYDAQEVTNATLRINGSSYGMRALAVSAPDSTNGRAMFLGYNGVSSDDRSAMLTRQVGISFSTVDAEDDFEEWVPSAPLTDQALMVASNRYRSWLMGKGTTNLQEPIREEDYTDAEASIRIDDTNVAFVTRGDNGNGMSHLHLVQKDSGTSQWVVRDAVVYDDGSLVQCADDYLAIIKSDRVNFYRIDQSAGLIFDNAQIVSLGESLGCYFPYLGKNLFAGQSTLYRFNPSTVEVTTVAGMSVDHDGYNHKQVMLWCARPGLAVRVNATNYNRAYLYQFNGNAMKSTETRYNNGTGQYGGDAGGVLTADSLMGLGYAMQTRNNNSDYHYGTYTPQPIVPNVEEYEV